MSWSLSDLDHVIRQAKLNRRSAAYLAALERQRARLVAGEEKAAGPAAGLPGREAGEAAAAVEGFYEAALALLHVAPGVGDEDADGIGQMLDCLASWFPLVPEDGEADDMT